MLAYIEECDKYHEHSNFMFSEIHDQVDAALVTVAAYRIIEDRLGLSHFPVEHRAEIEQSAAAYAHLTDTELEALAIEKRGPTPSNNPAVRAHHLMMEALMQLSDRAVAQGLTHADINLLLT